MTPERIKELRDRMNNENDMFDPGDGVECFLEMERLRNKLDWIAGVVAGMECPICKHVWDVVSE